ncbi:MAG: amidohydrolase family protein, partial [Aliifodinibius sp.]|nr:amidohydrolase family protein [candidate division Zixibacteria bacterium]NIT55278.1 amidohydrolase family protein [Fodinibius sp.]NIS46949.1 amidohydrolase family protein [candidate division Zixibacteria bacterium]NIU15096.1 amidohydrolase family protein [candidate division Zixibacteria bacterium]NIV07142.1 amidohydrolase family protein [candidate division Zixibacteria bacterium]
ALLDLAARICHLQYQSGKDRKSVKQFCEKYQDRILYATDLMQFPDSDPVAFKKDAHERWLSDWMYFTTDAIMTAPELEESFRGLALPEAVIEKIYRKNAERIFPGAWKIKRKVFQGLTGHIC